MSTLTAETIELQERRVQQNEERASTSITDPDDIVQQSLLVDSTVPEGGYGWVIVAASSVIMFWFTGINYSWGVVQAALVKEKVSSPSTLAFVGSLAPTLIALLAILNARLIRALGAQYASIIGVLGLVVGTFLSSFTIHNIGGLFVTVSVIYGAGQSLCFMVCSVIPSQYFKQKRGLAAGVVYSFGGIGGATISLASNALIQRVGIEWMFRILSAIILVTGLPAAWVMKERTAISRTILIEWRLLKDLRFVLLFLAGTIGTFPIFVPPFFLPLYAGALGFSATTGSVILAGFNISSAVGRLICGFASDKIGPVNTLFASLALDAICLLILWPVSESLGPLLVFVIACGAANGGFFAVMPTVVGSVFGSARLFVAMGMIVTGWTGGYLMGAPIAAHLLDMHGGDISKVQGYRPAMYYAGSMALASAGLVLFMRFNMDRSVKKRV